ncbi:hypothetical protein AGLY_014982 [Aphis glycines]|uniref:Uncharacterized protein n=1 Tax=Aphis glycines TaxID=307491 RepID=A0A6G0T347_APHGL|nr:hypothetical protein AGLY_014982 [Aphis glycines]
MPEIKLVLQIIPSINDISKTAVNGIIHSSNIPKQLSSAQSESLEEIQQIPNSVTELQLCDPTDNMKLIKNKVQTTYLKIFKTDVVQKIRLIGSVCISFKYLCLWCLIELIGRKIVINIMTNIVVLEDDLSLFRGKHYVFGINKNKIIFSVVFGLSRRDASVPHVSHWVLHLLTRGIGNCQYYIQCNMNIFTLKYKNMFVQRSCSLNWYKKEQYT